MTFTITYRGKDGALHEECVGAADRAACVAECRRRGISPIKIAEGGTGANRRQDGGVPSQRRLNGKTAILAAVVLAVIAGGVWWWFGGRGATALPMERPAKPKVEKPAKPKMEKPHKPTAKPVQPSATNAVPPKAESVQPPADEWDSPLYPGEKLVSSVTNKSSGYVIDVSMSRSGARTRHVRELPSIWESPTDVLIASVLQADERREAPPLPMMGQSTEREFLKSLEKPITINPSDSDEVKAIKQVVRSVREEIKARIDAGERFGAILENHRSLMNENGRIRMDAMRELAEIRRNGKPEDAEMYLKAMNQMFERMGIAPIAEKKTGEKK